ncbi:MAG: hypothetical protein NZ583_02625 [Desulfobacterota bacterium]|nr:hypothetical protein [Thermodesulfobacteriota bacterium]MDW8001780.1 hypothetical protein [Deltaproteobacteria bacterium]
MDDEAREEERKLKRLRFIVDFALNFIRINDISHDEALRIFEGVKKHALILFPDKEETFDIIYAPRFRRLLNEKYKRS